MIKINTNSDAWRRTAKSRLRFELAGLAFARQRGFRPEEYARHLWSKGAVRWMRKAKPIAIEYLLKEAEAFKQFYPDVSFKIVEAGDERAELVFTEGCLGGWGADRWAPAEAWACPKRIYAPTARNHSWSGQNNWASLSASALKGMAPVGC